MPELAAEFAVLRPTMREGLRILEMEGLVDLRTGSRSGARILEPTTETAAQLAGTLLEFAQTRMADVAEARALIEPSVMELVATRIDKPTLAALSHNLQELKSSQPHSSFHQAVRGDGATRTYRPLATRRYPWGSRSYTGSLSEAVRIDNERTHCPAYREEQPTGMPGVRSLPCGSRPGRSDRRRPGLGQTAARAITSLCSPLRNRLLVDIVDWSGTWQRRRTASQRPP